MVKNFSKIIKPLIILLRKLRINLAIKQGIILTQNKLKENYKWKVIEFGSQENIIVTKPDRYKGEITKEILEKIGSFTFVKPIVCEVPNAEICGQKAIGIDAERRIIAETTIPQFHGLEKVLLRGDLALPKNSLSQPVQQKLDIACSLICTWGTKNYFHWVLDSLARIEGVEYYQQQTGLQPKLIIENQPTPWQIESLSLLGYKVEDCIEWNMLRVQVEKLVVPSFRRDEARVSPMACSWLRERILNNLSHSSDEKEKSSSKKKY